MNLFRFIFIVFSIFFFTFLVNADECQRFKDKVLEIPEPESGYVTDGQQPKNDLGLFYQIEYNSLKNYFKIKRDKKNFPILKVAISKKEISTNTSILSLNNKDLSKLNDNEIIELNNLPYAKIKTENEEFIINKTNYDLYPFDLEYFTVNAIDEIQTKEGEFKLDYNFQVSHERPDWIEAGREIGELTICFIDDLIESSKIYSPVSNETIYLTQIGFDQDKSFATHEQVYFNKLDKTYSRTTLQGIARIKADFDLKNFPFDNQVLRIELTAPYNVDYNENKNYPKPFVTTFTPRKNVLLDLEKYKKNNYLKEWRIVDINIYNSLVISDEISTFDREKITQSIYDTISLDITVDRNTNYFIFKIIIPVFLILSIAWSVMWIPPNQVESRLTTSIVALLALIAYNFVFNEDLPKLSYLTSLDRYILLSYLFCAIPTFLTIYFSRLTKKDYNIALSVNKKSRLIGLVIYALSTTLIFSA